MKFKDIICEISYFVIEESFTSLSLQCENNVCNFFNVIVQGGADPWMYKHKDGSIEFKQEGLIKGILKVMNILL